MGDSIEGICLDCGIMQHIFEDDILAYFQFMIKFPESHKISTQATVATYSIYMCALRSLHRIINLQGFCISDSWHIRHFQTIGHMTGKTGIYDSSSDTFVFNHIHHLSYKRSCLPPKGTTRFHDNFKMRITLMKSLYYINKVYHIIILPGHQMTATEINPFQLREPR